MAAAAVAGAVLGLMGGYSDKRKADAESLLTRELGKRATEMKGEVQMYGDRSAARKVDLGTHKRRLERARQRGVEGVKGRRGGERGAIAMAMGTKPTTEAARTADFKARFKDPKTQFQAENAGNAFAGEMAKARGEQQKFTDQLAAYGGIDEGYQDLLQSNKIRSGEIGANIAGGTTEQGAMGIDTAMAQQAPDHALAQFQDADARFKKKMYDKYYSLRDHPDFGGLSKDPKAPMLGVPRRIKGSMLGSAASMASSFLGPSGLGYVGS
jgi:hypothetical protein